MKKETILVTGANGLLGQAVSKIFRRESDLNLILTSVEDQSYSETDYAYEKLDITRKEDVKKAVARFQPSLILNCAAYTDVDGCETERELCWKLNVDAVKNLIIAARPHGIKLVHISTDYVFDGKKGPYTEEDTPNPISFYGKSKLAAENAILASGITHAIARTMVLFGVGRNVKPNFAVWLVNKLSANQEINIVDDQIGNSTIVDNLAYGLLKIIEQDRTGIFNIAGKEIESRLDFTYKLCDVFGFDKSLITRIKTASLGQPAPRPLNSGLITLKAETELQFNPYDTIDSLELFKHLLKDLN